MVLQALNRYYHILEAYPHTDIPRFGYSKAKVNFAVVLSAGGEIVDILPLSEKVDRRGKEWEVPLQLTVPAQVKRTASIRSNFLCDNCTYTLGLSERDETDPSFAVYRYAAFCNKTREILGEAESQEARAVLAFLEEFDPYAAREHPVIADHVDDLLQGRNLVFKLEGAKGYIHEHPEVRALWEQYLEETSGDNENVGQCLATGKTAPVARLRGTVPTGASMVSFNLAASESNNRVREQGLNAPVSERAVFAYTTVLNWMLSSAGEYHKAVLAPMTVLYWAESADPVYQVLLSALFSPERFSAAREETQAGSFPEAERLRWLREGEIDQMMAGLDPDMRVHVLGMVPNRSRISVRFFHTDSFSSLVGKFMAHYQDMQMIPLFDSQPAQMGIRSLVLETVSDLVSIKKPIAGVIEAFLFAILHESPYPENMYQLLLNRIRMDRDYPEKHRYKINYLRVAWIKAYLLRKYRGQESNPFQDVLTFSLNEEAVVPAYLLGRVFALLENVHQEVRGGEYLRVRYFGAVCTAPSRVFPILLRILDDRAKFSKFSFIRRRLILKILSLFGEEKPDLPERFTPEEKGVFVLGYYHQRVAIFPFGGKSHTMDEAESE